MVLSRSKPRLSLPVTPCDYRQKAMPMSFHLDEIIQRLNPNLPAGTSDLSMPRISRDSNALRQIRTHLSADKNAKVLLTGHIGVGKSTEMLQLAKDMSSA